MPNQRFAIPGGRRAVVFESFRDWHELAACCGEPSELFYGPEGEKLPQRLVREKRALEICGRCPVRAECRSHAQRRPETYGVWGGTTESSRSAARRASAVRESA
ncbi:WhiB family transcriptional regulator [Actinopolymorpha pittospori]